MWASLYHIEVLEKNQRLEMEDVVVGMYRSVKFDVTFIG